MYAMKFATCIISEKLVRWRAHDQSFFLKNLDRNVFGLVVSKYALIQYKLKFL